MDKNDIRKKIDGIKREIRDYEKKIKTVPKELRGAMKIDVRKFRSRVRSLEVELDT